MLKYFVMARYPSLTLHIQIIATKGMLGTAICEQIKLIDIYDRGFTLHYPDIMNVADAVQVMFEYD